MTASAWVLGAVVGALLLERCVELALNRRNVAWLSQQGARFLQNDGFGLILAAQFVLFGTTISESAFAPWTSVGWWTAAAVCLLALAQALRYWAIATLGRRWCIRVATLPGAPRLLGGPYRFIPHPNYLAVALEAIALPLAFHAWAAFAIGGALNLVALSRRVRQEESVLRANEPPAKVGTGFA